MEELKIKICGLTNESDIKIVNRLKIDFAGFVLFFPKSKRNLEIARASELKSKLKDISSVAVTVSPDLSQLAMIENAGFDYIQIHGIMSREVYENCNIPIIRAFNSLDIDEIEKCSRLDKIEILLFDAAEPGSGKQCDWNSLSAAKQYNKKIALAGGLCPDNVCNAIKCVSPNIVDVSSGVEHSKCGKDPILCENFVRNARNTKKSG